MEPLIHLSHVSFSYHTPGGETLALSDIDFSVYPEEFLAIVGPSGCGKSTLLSILSGLAQYLEKCNPWTGNSKTTERRNKSLRTLPA